MKIAKNHLGSGFQSSWKMNNHTKLNLPWDFLNALYQFGGVPLFRKKIDRTVIFNIYMTISLYSL